MRTIFRITGSCFALASLVSFAQAQTYTAPGSARPAPPSAHASHAMPSSVENFTRPNFNAAPRNLQAPAAATLRTAALELADFERIALERNPTLAQASAQIDASSARALQAGLQLNPVVGYNGEQFGVGSPQLGEQQGFFIDQEFLRREKRQLSRAKYAQETEAARWQATAQEYRVINGIRLAYLDVLADQRRLANERAQVRNAETAAQTTEELVNVGQANEADLLQARVEARRSRVALRAEEARFRAAWAGLTSLAGAPELPPAVLNDAMLEMESPPLEFHAVFSHLIQASPEIQAALAEVRRDEITVQRERVEPRPNLFIRGGAGYNFEADRPSGSIQIGLRLPVFDRNQGTIREAQADLRQAQAEVDRVVLSLRRRLAETFGRYEAAQQSAAEFRAEILPDAQRATEVMRRNFNQRRAAFPQVLVAERAELQQEADYIDALLELRQAEVEIRGLLLIDGLSIPVGPTSQGHIESNPRPR